MIKAVCSIIVWGRAGFAELLILRIRSCLIWVMTASILLRPSVTVWILRTVVPGGTSLEKLSEWTGHWPWHRMPSNRKESRWRKWCITKPLCRAAYLFLMCPFLQQTVHFLKMLLMHAPQIPHTAHMHTHVSPWYSIIHTAHALAYMPEVSSGISLLYVRHLRINICRMVQVRFDVSIEITSVVSSLCTRRSLDLKFLSPRW